MSFIQVLRYIITTVFTISVAYFIGEKAGGYYQQTVRISKRAEHSASILAQMHDLKVGDKIPDFVFDNLSFESIMLRPLIKAKTILFFIEPECDACKQDIKLLTSILMNKEEASHFIIVSSGNPRLLIDIHNEYNILSPILYDHESRYSSIFGVFTYPFHIVIDKDKIVEKIITTPLEEEDIKKILIR